MTIILPAIVHLDLAIKELNLDKMPITRAINTLLLYAWHDDLPIYFNECAQGIDSSIPFGEVFNNDVDVAVDFEVADQKDIKIIHGAKVIGNAFVSIDKSIAYVVVNNFSYNKENYNMIDDSGTQASNLSIKYTELYLKREELLNFKESFSNGGKTNKLTPTPQKSQTITGEVKALALLAREKALSSEAYKTGDKVSASAFKNHIIKLAEKHYKEEKDSKDLKSLLSGLRSLDDKINKALNNLDLKQIIPNQDK